MKKMLALVLCTTFASQISSMGMSQMEIERKEISDQEAKRASLLKAFNGNSNITSLCAECGKCHGATTPSHSKASTPRVAALTKAVADMDLD